MPQGGAAPTSDAGPGPADKIASINDQLAALAGETAEADVPEEAKAALAAAVEAYQAFMSAVAGGGAEPPPPGAGQVSADGGPKGVPMSHGGRA
jgi:hypothetical protein